MAVNNNYPTPPQNPSLEASYLRKLMVSLLSAMSGKINCTGEFTVDPNENSTIIKNPLCNENSVVLPSPLTFDAGAEYTSGSFYIIPGNGMFTVYHQNIPGPVREFRYAIFG